MDDHIHLYLLPFLIKTNLYTKSRSFINLFHINNDPVRMNGFHGRIRMPEGRYITIEQILCYSQVFIELLAAYINDFPFCLVNRLAFIINQFHFGNTGLIIFCI